MLADTETHHGGEDFLGAVASCPGAKLPSYPEDLAQMTLRTHLTKDPGVPGSFAKGTLPAQGPLQDTNTHSLEPSQSCRAS